MNASPYLHDVPLNKAQQLFRDELIRLHQDGVLATERVALDENAVNRVLAEAVFAIRCAPDYHASAMDGFAVSAKSTEGALPSQPITLAEKSFRYVDTGDPLPDWADAVIPIENCEPHDEHGALMMGKGIRNPTVILIRNSVTPYAHVRLVGEDLITSQLILAAGQVIQPAHLGALAAGGTTTLKVARKPVVGILPTGDEIVPIGAATSKGQIIEFNSIVMAALVNEWGGQAKRYPVVKDDPDQICRQVTRAAAECDLVLVNAGSSAGSEDFTASVIAACGRVLVHGIAVRPGHPVVLGFLDPPHIPTTRSKPVIGVPGYPVSAVFTCELFVKPLIQTWLGLNSIQAEEVEARVTKKITSPGGDDELVQVMLGEINGKMLATPISRGAGVTSSLLKADGVLKLPAGIQGLELGAPVRVSLHRSLAEVKANLLTIGSHDLTLDILAQWLPRFGKTLVSSNVGSLGGLYALQRGESHFSGCHLLDPVSGIYNLTDIRKLFPNQRMVLLKWVSREQGLIVKRGNPKQIISLGDLTRPDVTFINRQSGSGTRVLLDYQLTLQHLDPEGIMGYENLEFTHLGVGVAVSSGRADCGLGIASAAAALDLQFIPLFEEEYDLILPESSLGSAYLFPIFDLAANIGFRKDILRLPGYTIPCMGEIEPVFPSSESV